MQSVSTDFVNHSHGQVRPVTYQLSAAFDKVLDPSITFFTLDTSVLDGPDLLAPDDDNILAEWNKYLYHDYSDRVISLEITQEELEPYSVVQSFADVVVNNYDGYFTPNSGSPIGEFILPKRPFRILGGFAGENIPLFIGLSDKIPEIDKSSRTATFHLIDFMTFIFGQEIGQSFMLTDASTGEILDTIFANIGLLPGQYILDDTSFNRIPFWSVDKGTTVGDIIQPLMEAEQGYLYMDEQGIIRYKNRQSFSTESVYLFNKSNTIDYSTSTEDDVINYVKITLNILEEQPEQSIWEQVSTVYVPAGTSVDVWAQPEDPITNITTPVYSDSQVEYSHYISTADVEGTIPYTGIVVDSIANFGRTVKITFENTGGDNAYVYAVDLWGTPVKVIDTIVVEDLDQDSIDSLELHPYELETSYIQDKNSAISKAGIIIDDYKDYGSILVTEVKGTPALQIADVITQDLDGYSGDFTVTKLVYQFINAQFKQSITSKFRTPRVYFILSSDSVDKSLLDGSDVLTP